MKKIFCNINLFEYKHDIVGVDTETGSIEFLSDTKHIETGANIAKCCLNTDIYNIHLFGDKNFINDFVIPSIEEYLNSNYNTKKINIEVN